MERQVIAARPCWRERVEDLTFDFHTIDNAPYWDETACWRFTAAEIDRLEDASEELHRMCLEAATHVFERGLLSRLGIVGRAAELAEASWRVREPFLYGRFDLAWDGTGAPKLLEYNADTPTSLFESAVVQWHWLEQVSPQADQFNSLHEGLVERWRALGAGFGNDVVHFTCATPHAEDEGTVRYLQATALEAGLPAKFLSISDIGWNGLAFLDLEDETIRRLFKLYPWEWLADDPFAAHIRMGGLSVLEPAWKMVLASKGLLPILWELFPGHPNLLPAAFDPAAIDTRFRVRKPLFGREGANVAIFDGAETVTATDGPYGEGGSVWQAWTPLVQAGNDCSAVLGLWMVGDRCRGMGIREDSGPITRDSSRFVPHYFE